MATSESIAAGGWFDKLGDGDQDEEELHPEGVVRLLLDAGQELGSLGLQQRRTISVTLGCFF